MGRAYRVRSIDLLRGVVMVVMALDHVRDYFYADALITDPTDLDTTTPALFFTRWITHFCAPVFVFLAGTAACLYASRCPSKRDLSRFLFLRGLWLVVLEHTVVTFAWTFDVTHSTWIFQVIWAIGVGMIVLAGLVYLPMRVVVAVGVVIVFGHNLLDGIRTSGNGVETYLWSVLHQQNFIAIPGQRLLVFLYPVLPWIGLMALGYGLGVMYKGEFGATRRRRYLLWMGLGSIALFVVLRVTNLYGDPSPFATQTTPVKTVMSFLRATKYPPSLLFLLMTIGPSLLALRAWESADGRVARALSTIGRVPLFFYVVHLYLIHLLALPGAWIDGYSLGDMILTARNYASGPLAGYGFSLGVVYAVWALVVAALYPLCRVWDRYKAAHPSRRWLRFL